MLTQHDVTVPNALDLFEKVKGTGLRYVGCKDVGLKIEELRDLFAQARIENMKTFLEVVSMKEDEHFRGVRTALEVKADHLIGGMPQYTGETTRYLREKNSKIKFFPYVGKIVGHPCLLRGSIEEIVDDAKRTENLGADGINLLAYRYDGDVSQLITSVRSAVDIPLIVAGNIDRFERIREMDRLGVWAFTIGGAILEKRFLPGKGELEQVNAVLKEIAQG
jgi:NAD(P)H-dependent flavin oxidoreductase YrpB (nitropropane dioxygenase family)